MISVQHMLIKQNKKEDNVVSQLTFKAGEDLPMDSFSSEASFTDRCRHTRTNARVVTLQTDNESTINIGLRAKRLYSNKGTGIEQTSN